MDLHERLNTSKPISSERDPFAEVKNRIHLDVRPSDSMAEEVDRVTTLGATVRGFIEESGSFWTQMRDPEGNEFCILRGPDDGWSPDEF